ncbi:MAG TPA: DUF2141 domain-containing protein, partial [Polyangiaceae bacterium]
RSALLLAVGVALVGAGDAGADPVATGALSVHLVGLRSDRGRGGCMLFGSEKGFPSDPGAALQKTWCAIGNGEARCRFEPAAAGIYAVACFHDENGNGKLDTGLFGIPSEGTVVSNEAKGFMGAPKFKDAKFSLPAGASELRLRMGY